MIKTNLRIQSFWVRRSRYDRGLISYIDVVCTVLYYEIFNKS